MSDGSTGTPESPAQVLRRAAGLIRERAAAATEGPWLGVMGIFKDGEWPCVVTAQGDPKDPATWLMGAGNGGANREANATHVASWHPLVALAVADWLQLEAASYAVRGRQPEGHTAYAEAVARAYLGEETPA